jgi:hypothetical protein
VSLAGTGVWPPRSSYCVGACIWRSSWTAGVEATALTAARPLPSRSNRPTDATETQVPVQLSRNWRPAQVEGLPAVFTGGWVGYAGYDTVRYVYAGASTFDLSTPARGLAALCNRPVQLV